MRCAACIGTIERGLGKIDGVERVRANLSNRTVAVTWHRDRCDGPMISKTLSGLGYDWQLAGDSDNRDHVLAREQSRLLLALAVAGFAAANIMLLSVSIWSGADQETTKLFHLLSGLIAVPAIAYAGRPFFVSAFGALSVKRLNMDVPISLAVLLALAMSMYESIYGGGEAYFDAAVTLLFFLLIGRYLDHRMRVRTQGAVRRLAGMAPKRAARIAEDGTLAFISLSAVAPGMRLRVFAGERVPVDGVIVAGASDFDKSLVTGEAVPVSGTAGDLLAAGLLNLTGPIDIEATSDAAHSFLAEIIKMMEAAQRGRGRYVRIAERMAQIYAPAVHLLALITFVGWMVISAGDWHMATYNAIAVLIITCPCALGLAVPVVHVLAAGRLFDHGVMVRDGSALERLAEVDMALFDKTGTLSDGQPIIVAATATSEPVQRQIKALAQASHHPLAQAIADYLPIEPVCDLTDVIEIPGFGVEAKHNRARIRLGRADWALEIATGTPDKASEGVVFAREGMPATVFLTGDRLRPGAKAAIDVLKAKGIDVGIISGDASARVEAVARQLGVADALACITPRQKVEHVEAYAAQNRKVLMVGDGLNDAPALGAGHVSMGPASASQVGLLACDLIFTRNDLGAVPFAFKIAGIGKSLVRQNFAIAILYNCISIPLAMAGMVTPLIAAIAMSASSLAVVANSMRLQLAGDDLPLTTKGKAREPQLASGQFGPWTTLRKA